MSKITNDSLTRSGTGCFIIIAVPLWQQWASKCSRENALNTWWWKWRSGLPCQCLLRRPRWPISPWTVRLVPTTHRQLSTSLSVPETHRSSVWGCPLSAWCHWKGEYSLCHAAWPSSEPRQFNTTAVNKYIHCVQKKNTHSLFLSYLYEWCVDLNKNCSEYT